MVGTLATSNLQIEIASSKSGHAIPKISGVYLHSMLDPIQESLDFVNKHHQEIATSPSIVILGLGFGYHVDEVLRTLKRYHRHYQLAVINPFPDLIPLINKYRTVDLSDHSLSIFTTVNPGTLFYNKDFLKILLDTPKIIPHRQSLERSKDFFKSFLSFKHPENEKIIFQEKLNTEFIKGPTESAESFLYKALYSTINFEEICEGVTNEENINH